MIIVDSSCVLAILQNELEKDAFREVLAGGDRCLMSAVNIHEALCVMRGRYGAAAAAFDRYGKGVNSKSSLNLADCAAYALARTMSAPLLFKGDDFINTDIARA